MEDKPIREPPRYEPPRAPLYVDLRHRWETLTPYERFEQVVAIVLGGVISVIVAVALVELIREVVILLMSESLSPLKHETFQVVFGMIMTLLIALEFKHSAALLALGIVYWLMRDRDERMARREPGTGKSDLP